MPEHWTKWLTEEERKVLLRAEKVLKRTERETLRSPWYRRSPARAKAIVSAYHALAASRALVAEKDKALEGYIAADTALGPDLTDEDVSRIRDINLARGSAALALTEADIAGLEAKS